MEKRNEEKGKKNPMKDFPFPISSFLMTFSKRFISTRLKAGNTDHSISIPF
jgi:hypothetical protein